MTLEINSLSVCAEEFTACFVERLLVLVIVVVDDGLNALFSFDNLLVAASTHKVY